MDICEICDGSGESIYGPPGEGVCLACRGTGCARDFRDEDEVIAEIVAEMWGEDDAP